MLIFTPENFSRLTSCHTNTILSNLRSKNKNVAWKVLNVQNVSLSFCVTWFIQKNTVRNIINFAVEIVSNIKFWNIMCLRNPNIENLATNGRVHKNVALLCLLLWRKLSAEWYWLIVGMPLQNVRDNVGRKNTRRLSTYIIMSQKHGQNEGNKTKGGYRGGVCTEVSNNALLGI